ncbi:glycosyltransferase family 2 protein [Bacillus mobilis]|uniref:glycosyltransferase family 2 protein n=1 Tax=Bacillus mobilis TaxID=2026190 RepID=UPI0021D3A97C|nr:glycosyltransferase family 2 protein [Bacillus mobilis]MCU5198148.1 glycosyltransferase [Bacillus mobilis]
MNPIVSICTPVYNHEVYLESYFQSIINQTYENIELILINDNSKDNSHEVIVKWLDRLNQRFNKVIYINREENQGLIYNCNESIHLSSGKYICIFASDDIMHPNNIEYKVQRLENHPDEMLVYSDGFLMHEEATISNLDRGLKGRFSEEKTLYKGDIFQKLVDYGSFIPAPSVVMNKLVIEEVGGYSTDYMFEDYQMWLKISERYKVGFIEEALIYYRLSSGSLSRDPEKFLKLLHDHERLLMDLKLCNNDINISKGLQSVYKQGIEGCFRHNLKIEFDEYYNRIEKKTLMDRLKQKIISISIFYQMYTFVRKSYKLIK